MANNEKIDELISEKAFEQLDRLLKGLNISSDKMAELTGEADKLNKAISSSKSMTEFAENTKKANDQIEKTQKQLERTRLEEIRLQHAREKAFDKYDKQLAKEQAQLAKSENLYNKVQAKVNQLSATYNNLAIKQQLGLKLSVREEAQLLSLEKRLNTYQTALIKVDAQIQKNGRNVGNYASGFNPLNNAIGQISRELPNFGQSFQIGVLSLTNNIGALQDAIGGIIAQNKILISQGQPTKSVFSQILGSVLSFNTGLFVAIGLFSAYSKEISEFVSDLFTFEARVSALDQRIKETTRSQKAYNDVILEGAKNAQVEIVSIDLTRKSIENINVPLSERNKLVDDLQKEYPKYFGNLTNEQILAGNVGNAYKLLKDEIIAASLARAAQDQIVENSQRELDNERKTIEARRERIKLERDLQEAQKIQQAQNEASASSNTQFGSTGSVLGAQKVYRIQSQIAAVDKTIYNLRSDTNKLNADNLRLIQRIGTEVEKNGANVLTGNAGGISTVEETKKTNDALLQLELYRAQTIAGINSSIASDTIRSEEDRFSALEKSVQSRQRVLELERDIALDNEDLVANERIKIQEEFINKSNQLDIEASQEALQIAKDNISARQKEIQEANKIALNDLAIQRDEELAAINGQGRTTAQIKEDYAEKEFEINQFYNRLIIEEEIKQTERLIEQAKLRGENVSDQEAKIAALKLKLAKDVTSGEEKELLTREERQKKFNEFVTESAFEVADIVSSLVNSAAQSRLDALDKESEKIQQNYDFEKEQIEESLISEEEKNIRLGQLDADRAAQEEAIEQRKREIQIQQARFAKAMAIAEIAYNTGAAIMGIWAQVPKFDFGISAGLLTGVVSALGAAQIATVLATPIPGYYKGVESSPEGLAYVGERGTEGRINPDGSFELTPNKSTLTYLEKGTQIIPHNELNMMLANAGIDSVSPSISFDSNGIKDAISKSSKDTIKAIKSSKSPGLQITKGGWKETNRKIEKFNNYIRRNIN